MPQLAVFAHFDPHGEAARHCLRHLEALHDIADRVVIVTTAELTPAARGALAERGELIERSNEGYDFYSWKVGLEYVSDWPTYEHMIVANDSVVGPVVPYRDIVDTMRQRGAPAWGASENHELEPHLQSFVLGFFPSVLRSALFQAFWHGMAPLSRRTDVIARYERGLSRLLSGAGLSGLPYFEPTRRDNMIARRRRARFAALSGVRKRRIALRQAGVRVAPIVMAREARRELRHRHVTRETLHYLRRGGVYNPMIALWDRALDGRLPFVKIETLRDDPYRLNGDKMLAACERRYPREFEGVREYLQRTQDSYAHIRRPVGA